ncbi:MAG TPA: FHA domain-containing protein [Isosphaeraceae bacterium]|nr:FHA domain-containing protein [Isosphaeraceae bacterium]
MTSFSNACGVKDALLFTIEGPESTGPELRGLSQPFVVIGRDRRTDLLLENPQVSRRHVYLQVIGGWVFWMDLESRTGTRTEAGLRKSGWLREGQHLGIGPFTVRWSGGAVATPCEFPEVTPLVAQTYGREPLPEVALEFLNGPSQSMFWPMRRVMSLIGSAKGCKYRLADPSVSAFHASLLRTPAGLWVVDLRGGQSITVNAVPVRTDVLVDGDVLGIGQYRIRMRVRYRNRDRDRGSADGMAARGRASGAGRLPRSSRSASLSLLQPDQAQPVPGDPPPVNTLPVPIVATGFGVEVLSSTGSTTASLNPPGTSESVLVPLVNQFSLMQQQMFDQFQQAMSMLVRMFGTMHREQMDVIRDELDRLHQLTEELQALRSELANSSRGPTGPRAGGATAAAGPERRAAPNPSLAAVPPLAAAGRREPTKDPSLPPVAAAAGPPPSSKLPPSPRRDPPQDGSTTAAAGTPREPAPYEGEALLWIHQRIAALQQERETSWQKILKLIPGAP